MEGPGLWRVGTWSGRREGAGGRAYQQVLLLELGDLVLALLLLFLDGLLDTPHEGVELRLPLLLLLQAVLEDVQADDDELVLVGEWPLRKLTAAWGGRTWGWKQLP